MTAAGKRRKPCRKAFAVQRKKRPRAPQNFAPVGTTPKRAITRSKTRLLASECGKTTGGENEPRKAGKSRGGVVFSANPTGTDKADFQGPTSEENALNGASKRSAKRSAKRETNAHTRQPLSAPTKRVKPHPKSGRKASPRHRKRIKTSGQSPPVSPSNPLVFSSYQSARAKGLTLFRIRLRAPYIYSLLYSNACNQ